MSRSEIRELQLNKLKALVKRCYEEIPFYTKKFDAIGLKPEHIKTFEDIRHIPPTSKDDLRDNYPFGIFGVPKKEIVRLHASSGTTGKPTVVGYTREDLDIWSDCVARFAVAVGVNDEDTAQISFGYGLFTGALGLHYGLEKIGCSIIPISAGNTEKQLMLMEDFGTTVLIATPSYATYLSEVAKETGVAERLNLRIGLFGSESCTEEMRAHIERNLKIIATDNYGLSEVGGPGLSGECIERNGLHIAEDHFLTEIVDENFEPLSEGETGEMLVTTLSKRALPMLRYRTKDVTRLNYAPCKCGRTMARMDKVMGRTDDMLIIKGVNVFPSQIESCLVGMQGIGPHYLLTVRRERFMDSLEVSVELTDGSLLERYSELESLQKNIKNKLHSVLGLDCAVTLVAPRTIERFQGKAKRVIDLRNKENK